MKPLPNHIEDARVAELQSFKILDTEPELIYDELVFLAAHACSVPMALITLVDRDRLWFKAKVGSVANELPRELTFCDLVIKLGKTIAITDLTLDERTRENPYVTKNPQFKSYASAPIISHSGLVLGTVCVLDFVPREFSAAQIRCLETIARQTVETLELRKQAVASKQTNDALELDKQLYLSLVNNLNEVVFQTDAHGQWKFLSPAWEDLMGIARAEVIGKHILDYIHADHHAETKSLFKTIVSGEKPYLRHRVRYIASHDEIKWVDVYVRVTRDEGGQLTGTTGTLTDVSEAVFAQEESDERASRIAISQAQFEMMASHLGEVVWMTDVSKQKMIYIGKVYEQIWEQSCESLYENPQSFLDPIHPDDRNRVIHALTVQAIGGYDIHYRLQTKTGKIKWIHDRCFPIRDENGAVIRILGLAADITQSKRQQQMIEEQRAHMIQSARLSSLGEMAAGIAHEINNPLAIIKATSQLLSFELQSGKAPSERTGEMLLRIDTTASRIAKIISGLRNFARDGEMDPFAVVSVSSILNDTFELCRARFKNHGVQLIIDSFDEALTIECRATQISQAVLNLLNNAFDACSGSSEPAVQIRVENRESEVCIHVFDNGPGVPAEIIQKVWEPFFTTKDVGKGTGLGLSLSRGLIETHKGEMEYERQDGRTCFSITLPKEQKKSARFAA